MRVLTLLFIFPTFMLISCDDSDPDSTPKCSEPELECAVDTPTFNRGACGDCDRIWWCGSVRGSAVWMPGELSCNCLTDRGGIDTADYRCRSSE